MIINEPRIIELRHGSVLTRVDWMNGEWEFARTKVSARQIKYINLLGFVGDGFGELPLESIHGSQAKKVQYFLECSAQYYCKKVQSKKKKYEGICDLLLELSHWGRQKPTSSWYLY